MTLFGKPGFVTMFFRHNSLLCERITLIILGFAVSRRSVDPMLTPQISAGSKKLWLYTPGATRVSVQYCSRVWSKVLITSDSLFFHIKLQAVLTECDGCSYLDRVLLTVINKGNGLVVSLDAIDCHSHSAIRGARLQDGDVIDGLPISVVDLGCLPIRSSTIGKSPEME